MHDIDEWDGAERRQKTGWDGVERRANFRRMEDAHYLEPQRASFALNNWGALVSFASLIVIGVGIISWGLKLESRIDSTNAYLTEVRHEIADGVLPVTKTKLEQIQQSQAKMQSDMDALRLEMQRLGIELARLKPRFDKTGGIILADDKALKNDSIRR